MALVTVVIINFNGAPYLPELLDSLEEQTFRDFRAVLVDNASQDDSCEIAEAHPSDAALIRLPTNRGFAAAGNLGAGRTGSPYIAFLNPDLRLEPRWLEELLAAAGKDREIAAAAPKMLLYDRRNVLNGVGGAMNYLGYTWDRGMFEEDRGQLDAPAEVLFAPAAASLFRRDAFLEAGGFDERFFMYHEDVDLGWRLWLFGHRILTAPQAVVHHHFGGLTKVARGMMWREVLGERNAIRSLIKNYERPTLLRALRHLLLLGQRWPRKLAQLRNLLWNLAFLPETLEQRSMVQKRRMRSDRDLQPLIVQSKHVPVRL
jgi:GT2 family glycosyltransferase